MKIYSGSEIAKLEGVSQALVKKWAKINNVSKLSQAKTSAYVFNEKNYEDFKNRCKKIGRKIQTNQNSYKWEFCKFFSKDRHSVIYADFASFNKSVFTMMQYLLDYRKLFF